MKKPSLFSLWHLGLGCVLAFATLGCGDSERGLARGSDGGLALGGHADSDGKTARDAVQAERGLANDGDIQDRRPPNDVESVNPSDSQRDGSGGAVAEDANFAADTNQETDDAGGAAQTDTPTIPIDGQPDLDSAGPSNVDAPIGTGGPVNVDAALDRDGVGGANVSIGADGPGGDTDPDRGNGTDSASIDAPGAIDGVNLDGGNGTDSASIDAPVAIDGVNLDGGDDWGGSAVADAWLEGDALDGKDFLDGGGIPDVDGSSDASGANAGYAVQGDYLRNPDLAKDMLKSLADFRVRARDTVNGGSFTYTKVDGTVSSDHRKSFVTQTRDAWAFARAFMITGDENYLTYAAQDLDFLYAHGWDDTSGGWYFISDEEGKLTSLWPGNNPNTFKGSFIQHYALLGIGALCDATHDDNTCAWLQTGRRFLDEKMWDSRPSQLGYYDYGSLDLTTVRSKSFTSTVDAMTTHAIQSVLLWPTNSDYRQRLVDLANIVVDRLAANIDLPIATFGFPENYDTDWAVDTAQTAGNVGHVLKSAWVLARTYLRTPDGRYRTAAHNLIYEVLNNGGWDEAHGVPYTNTNWSTGAQDTSQAECWEIQQAIMSGLSNWYIADNQADKDVYLRMADRALSFFATYVVDHVDGGTWKMNNIDGTPKGNSKSNEYNVEYHSTETFYFAYLYGNLMLHRRPVTLYYRLSPKPTPQVIQLNPVSIDDASLRIQYVTLNEEPFAGFSGHTREVTLAANQGGKLAVTFGAGQ